MKRSGMPQRTKPLERGAPLARGSQLARTTRLKPRSSKMAAVYKIRRPLVATLLETRPWCEIHWDADCQGRSTDVHEPEMRSRGCDITDENACITACRYCHDQVHLHPAEATERGFMIPSRPVAKPWQVIA